VVGFAQRPWRVHGPRYSGQAIYNDPKAEMVIARFASHPLAANANFDPTTLLAFHAPGEYLMHANQAPVR
jgi:hypothetical protein